MNLRPRVHRLLEPAGPGDRASRMVDLLLIALILGDFGAFVLETSSELATWRPLFRVFEQVAVTVFLVEYVLRAWSITASERFRDPLRGRLAYLVSPMALVDLVAIVPAFFMVYHWFAGGTISEVPGQLTLVRLVRLVRLFKIARYSPAIVTVQRALHRVRHELNVLFAGVLVVLVVASTLLHAVESEAQPETFGSIPQTFWYAVITLTTIGFGDVVVVTPWGKMITSILGLIGISIFALPSGLLGAAFATEIRRTRSGSRSTSIHCPHCSGWMRYDPVTGVAHPEEDPYPPHRGESELPEEPL